MQQSYHAAPPGGKPGTTDAAALRRAGLALCRVSAGQKKPTDPGWPTRSLEAGDFGPGDLYGIITGPLSHCNRPGHALVIVDADGRAAVERADEFLPATAMLEGKPDKPRDHRGFLIPLTTVPAWAESTAEQAAPAARRAAGHPGPFRKQFRHKETNKVLIDFLGTGGQAVCPSPGNRREWVGGTPGTPAVVSFLQLWDAVSKLALACGGKMPAVDRPGRPAPADPARVPVGDRIKRAIAYLQKVDPAVSGEGGHDATYWPARVACWGFDLGEQVGFEVLRDHFNDRCTPKWSHSELKHKCHDADNLPFGKARGWLLAETNGEAPAGGGGGKAPPAKGGESTPAGVPDWAADVNLTDVGNGRRVAREHGSDLRFCWPWKRWLVWAGNRWAEDDVGEAVRRVKMTQTGLRRWAARQIDALGDAGDEQRKADLLRVLKHCLSWEDAKRLAACLETARSEPGIPVVPADLDRDPFLLNVLNGTLDLRTGQLRPHRREDLLTKLAPVNYHPDAKCPLWERSLARWMDGNGDLAGYLQRVVGYGLTGDVSEQCLWFFHGTGANGKSTFLLVLLALLGDYAMQAVGDLLMAKLHETHPTERADLVGRRVVATIETEEGKRLAEALLKQMTGGDKVRARKMRQDFFEFQPTHKIILAANHKPTVRGTDQAVWRRIKLVPFTVTIPDDEKDKSLAEKLKAELPGVLNWALAGCRAWREHGLGEPDEVRQATATYRAEQDSVQGFLEECCVLHPEARIKGSALLEAYYGWSGDRLMSRPAFTQRLKDKGFESKRGTGGCYFWHGVGLPADDCDSERRNV
jgi:putative DNA primase/helicase